MTGRDGGREAGAGREEGRVARGVAGWPIHYYTPKPLFHVLLLVINAI